MALRDRIDPRRSLVAAVGWLVIALTMCLVVSANLWLRGDVRAAVLEQHSRQLESAGEHVSDELDAALSQRLQSVSTVAAILSSALHHSEPLALQHALSAVQREVPDLVWMAVTDPNGDVVAATDPAVVGSNIYQYAWASQGLDVAWVAEDRRPDARYLSLSAPVRDAHGAIVGAVAAQVSWSWLERLASDVSASPGTWLLVDRDGVVALGPPAWRGRRWQDLQRAITPFDATVALLGTDASDLPPRIDVRRLADDRPYLLANVAPARHSSLEKLGWTIVVAQPVASVAALATDIEWRITVVLLVLGVIAAVAGIVIARRLTQRIRVIAQSASDLLSGHGDGIQVPAGVDEAARLGSAIDRLLNALRVERDELRALNAELDRRVAQRTEEIRRLADQARDAAVVRERLRLARDLHDTLAHSMMAMLTEIRLLKRLATVRPADLPDELVRAEEAARQGLDEARKAIVQLRSNPVQELGLGPALAETLRSLGERSGLDARLVVDGAAAQAADARAEALYRIAEELLRNVERHARAHHVTVSVRGGSTNGALQIEVRDDGVGFDPAAVGAGHYGLVGVREQAEAIGAHVEIQSDAGVGTRVIVEAGPSALPGDGHAT